MASSDDSNVVIFPGNEAAVYSAISEPQKDVIENLEWFLDRAKRGEIQAFAIVAIEPGGYVTHGWVNSDGHFHELNSGIALTAHKFMTEKGLRRFDEHPGPNPA